MTDALPPLLEDFARSLAALERLFATSSDPRLHRLLTARRRAVAQLGRVPAPPGPLLHGPALIAAEWRLMRRLTDLALTLPPGDPLRVQMFDLQAEVAESALTLSRMQL